MYTRDRIHNLIGLIALFMYAMVSFGCEGFLEQEEVNPFFSVTVEGEDFERSFNGEARFGMFTEPETDEEGLMIQMSSRMPEEGHGILLVGKLNYVPENNSYDLVAFVEEEGMAFENIDEEDFYGVFLVGTLDQDSYSDQFKSLEGEITFDSREGEMLYGEMEFTTAGYQKEGGTDTEIELSVQGVFEALEAEIELGEGL